ncbi:sugar ABC transporter permease [Thermoanaerobacter sp. YS13]|uniref:carbohydrate ABC transporter permease n=1 Tax=Thermoanaerobacter sp. YS13 TaxID=1511746 RepID=UPI000575059A|nr:sugar ABC transporter permease [Thermoanaerobacter sp. YS13]KHO62706.1 sugar ABC transporter permease [Thermoanaerobacter sp. YS13]
MYYKTLKILKRKFQREEKEVIVMLIPTYAILILFMGYPLLNSLYFSFQKYRLSQPNKIGFNGIENYINILNDPNLKLIMFNTLKWVFFTLILQFILGFILALALRKPFKGRNFYQAIVFLPWALSNFVVGLTFQWMFNGEYGVINDLLLKLKFISHKISFLGSTTFALWTVIIAMVWIGIPFFAIMILAALQSIPEELYEAAEIDGAGVIMQFLNITLPLIKPTIIVTLLLRTIWIFNSAELIYVMTYGGPGNSSNTFVSYMFLKAYSSLNFGEASAMGVLVMICLMLYSIIFIRITGYAEGSEF